MQRPLPILFLLIILAACTPAAQQTSTVTAAVIPTPTTIPTATATATAAATAAPTLTAETCLPAPIIAPTLPAVIPGYAQLDETTGLHITGTYQVLDPASYRLKVTGKVDHPLSLSLDELRCMPKVSAEATIICQGLFEDTTRWSGVPLQHILDLAELQSDVQELLLIGADGYKATITRKQAQSPDAFLACQWKDEPLPILHGFPVRAVMPSLRGSAWTKWLIEIQAR